MPLTALTLLLTSAVLHVTWNLIIKQAGEKLIVTWWALLVGTIVFSPFLIFALPLPNSIWLYGIASALFECAYYGMLAYAYHRHDFSIVYPIARGTAPVFTATWAVLLLHETLQPIGLAGLIAIVLGLMVIGTSVLRQKQNGVAIHPSALIAPFVLAVCISGYSTIDGAAAKLTAPLAYTIFIFALTTILLTPIVLKQYSWPVMKSQWRMNWKRMSLIGVLMVGAYMLVVTAFSLAQVAYVGAVREISIVLAALAGWLILGESFGLRRTIGAALITIGVILITLAR
jgi:drug/metabolite transporter (DMT)-like permease